jgi:predicted DNA-binding transcriptional regulator AlpA
MTNDKKYDLETEKFLSERELAQLLNIKSETLRNWRWDGKGPIYIKIGTNVRYRMSDINDFINKRVRTSTSDTGVHKNEF